MSPRIRLSLMLPLIMGSLFFQQAAHAQLTQPNLQVGCNWFLVFGPNGQGGGNTAFPDDDVYYWLSLISEDAPAGSVVHIDGQYDSARYFAFHVYNGSLQEFDSIADYLIKPAHGNANPFVGPAQIDSRIPDGGSYAAFLQLGTTAPAARADNTIYRPVPIPTAVTREKRTALAYRTYLKNGTPNVDDLPKLTLVTPDGTSVALADTPDTAACASLQSSYRQDGAKLGGSADLVDPAPAAANPVFKKYTGAALGLGGGALPTAAGSVGYNPENGFLFVKTNATLGDLLLIRGKAPFYATQSGGPTIGQVRYWSICENNFDTQQVIACVPDVDAVIDDPGFYTVVIGQGAQPAGATTGAGFNWLPFGDGNTGDPILRYLLQDPTFTQGIDQVKSLANPSTAMGEYAPLATYCSSAVFAANASSGPQQTFEACAASRGLGPVTGSTPTSNASADSSGDGNNGSGSLDVLLLAMLASFAGLRFARRLS